jgi:AcrR family transcriptional regulator
MSENIQRGSSDASENIFNAAANLFSQYGYAATSIEDIAKSAGVNKASIYYYYKNKASILYELVILPTTVLSQQANPIIDSEMEPLEKLETLIRNHLIWQMANPVINGVGHWEKSNLPKNLRKSYVRARDEYEAIYRRVLDAALGKEQIRNSDIKLTSRFMLGFMNSIVLWYKTNGTYSPEEIASEAVSFILKSLTVPKA